MELGSRSGNLSGISLAGKWPLWRTVSHGASDHGDEHMEQHDGRMTIRAELACQVVNSDKEVSSKVGKTGTLHLGLPSEAQNTFRR